MPALPASPPALPASPPVPALPASPPVPALPASPPMPALPASPPVPALPASPPVPVALVELSCSMLTSFAGSAISSDKDRSGEISGMASQRLNVHTSYSVHSLSVVQASTHRPSRQVSAPVQSSLTLQRPSVPENELKQPLCIQTKNRRQQSLKWNVAMFLWGQMINLVLQHFKCTENFLSSIPWMNNCIDIAEFGSAERVRKGISVFSD